MPQKYTTNSLELEISDLASLKQAVEWVAFEELPLTAPYDDDLRSKGSIWLRNSDPDSSKIQAICDAQRTLFVALRKGVLLATAYAVDEIEIANYDQDTPYFKTIEKPSKKKSSSKPQVIANTFWDYDSIFWSDSSLIYDRRNLSKNRWLLAKYIRIETSRLFDLFPPEGERHNKESSQESGYEQGNSKTHTGDPGRPSSAYLYIQEFERRIKENKIETTLAGQARVLRHWFTSNHTDLAQPTEGTIQNRIRDSYKEAKKPMK